MYKVFLVDDEIVVREGIRANFPWDETEFVLAGEAPDGEIALSMLQDIKPDILITDIRMPFMDGLELCRRVSRTMPWIYIIILSGYDDFAYAREAISLGVKEYLLKPVTGQELRKVLEDIAVRIREEKQQQASLNAYREQVTSSKRYLREKLLIDLFNGGSAETILQNARTLQINLLAKHYLVMLLHADEEPKSEDESISVQSVLERLSDGSGGAVQLCRLANTFCMLVMGDNGGDIEERAYGLAQAATYDVERSTGVKLRAAIGADVGSLGEVAGSMQSARSILDHLRDGPSGKSRSIIGSQDLFEEAPMLPDMDAIPLSEQLRYAGIADLDYILSKFIESLGEGAAQSIMMANYLFVEIMMAASRMIRDNGGIPQEIIPDAFRARQSILNVEEVLPMCRNMLKEAVIFRDSRSSMRYGNVIRKACAFIDEQYADSNLTLNDVATHVSLSNNHFCTVFSQEMGETFTEYLTSRRMARAKQLLISSDMRTGDVAYAVGYNDPHYFSYLFKKNTGVSPRDYRKDNRINGK